MNLTITPARLAGTIAPPPSKSQAHRYLIAAALAGGGAAVHNLADSQDIQATRRCMSELKTFCNHLPQLDCGESGSTLRFLIPLALALRDGGVFTGQGRLMDRPQTPYFQLFVEKGIRYRQENGILTVEGRLTPGVYRLPGNISSQFVTGLLYALPLLDGDSEIILTTALESRGYVDMTLEALGAFGVKVLWSGENTLSIPGGQKYVPAEVRVEADWSQAAFWLAANCLGSEIILKDLNSSSTQGDRAVSRCAQMLSKPGNLEISLSDCPDLGPPLAAMAAVRQGGTRLVNAARLRIKESDRLAAITAVLNAMGAEVEEFPDSLSIRGKDGLAGGCTVDCRNDHRIAMMAAAAATRCREPVTLLGAECVAKSYPDFWKHYRLLGGIAHEYLGE